MILTALAWMVLSASAQAGSFVPPPIIVSSTGTVPATGLAGDESDVAVDACGNIYALQQNGGELDEIPAGGGAATKLLAASSNGGPASMSMDATRSNLYVIQAQNSGAIKIPITNCVAQTSSTTTVGIGSLPESSNGWGYLNWWYGMFSVAADTSGNVFMASDMACCSSVNSLVEIYASAGYSTSIPLLGWSSSLPNSITSIAVDFNNNIYYVTGGVLYELPVATAATSTAPATYSTTPVLYGSGYSTNVVGVTVDSFGNLYVADGGNSVIYEIPYETNGSTSALNPSDQFVVATGVTVDNPVAPDLLGNLYFANNGASVYKLSLGSANLSATAVGSSVTATANVVFNAAETPASITFSPNSVFTSTGGTCTASSYTAGESCTINAKFAPTQPGVSISGITLADASNNVLATAYLSGTGLGAGITLDSGAVTSFGSGFSSPQSITVSPAGGYYIADSGADAVLYFATTISPPVSIGAGLKNPLGVAVDGAGNVIIADTGNNKIVEVPVINGVLTNADQVTIISSTATISGTALKAPAGVTIDGQGNLIIADTGNNRIVYLPYNGSWNVANASVVGSDLSAPLATTVDPSGNLYVANSGSGQIYMLPQPYSSGVQQLVAVGYNNPSALATDASGSLFVVDQGANAILRIPNISGALNPNTAIEVGFGVAAPYGVALDSTGNLYVTDATSKAAYEINRVSTTEDFGDWALSSTSGALPVKVENEGNQTLTFDNQFDVVTIGTGSAGDFILGTPTGATPACANNGTVVAGASCEMDFIFDPQASGTRSQTFQFQSNSTNATAPQVYVTGVGSTASATTTVLAVTSPTGTPSFGQAITLTATVTSTGGTPAGSAQLLVDGVITGEATLSSGGVATFSLPMGLSGGSHSLQAVYLGTSSFNGSTSSVLTVTVSTTATTTTLTITPPNVSPNSVLTGGSVTFTATINFAGVGIPTGTVTFATGSTTLGTASVAPAAGGLFQATLTTTALPVGTDTITATYGGDANYVGSSASGTVTVVNNPLVIVTPSGASITVNSKTGSSSTITLTPASYGGFNGIVGFQCDPATLPADSTCVFSPGQVNVTPNTHSVSYPEPPVTMWIAINQPPQTPTASKMIWWIAGPTSLLLLFVRRRMKAVALAGHWNMLLLIAAIGALSAGIMGSIGCSNGISYVTPKGTSTVTVYAYADTYVTGTTNNTTSTCTASNVYPCSKQAISVSVLVQ
jgi:sugar lactone lactonase YvrE